MTEVFTLDQLIDRDLKALYSFAKELGIQNYSELSKKELALAILRMQETSQGFFTVDGILDILQGEGYGFLRRINYSASHEDVYISSSQIRRFELRNGDQVTGPARAPKQSERYAGLMSIQAVNGKDPEEAKQREHFPGLTPLYPNQQMVLAYHQQAITNRLIDLVAPIGFGQRSLIVSPPKAGKTSVLKEIAKGIASNHPEAALMVLLIDERPEEVTDIERDVDGEVIYSTFDQQPEQHIKIAELALDRAMRLVEDGRNVVILLDSITRLARAYNLVSKPSGRTLSGGIDPAAFYLPKRFFGAARNIENGGSLTIIATALVETGSRMDDVIYEEFKGTGNSEIHLSRSLAERRIFPAIDIKRSGTRREELLLSEETLEAMWRLRKWMTGDALEYTEQFIQRLRHTKNNQECVTHLLQLSEKR